ncbi:magnesium and cobalt transport protein CorA [Flindersiella endophytica]
MIVDCGIYREGKRVASPNNVDAAAEAIHHDTEVFCWLGLHAPDESELGKVAQAFDLHELAVEDALEAHQRPKLERYGEMLFMVLKTLWYDDTKSEVGAGEILVFVGKNFVVTVRHGEGSELRHTRAELEQRASVLGHGPTAVLYAICDHVVDEYAEIAAELEIDVDDIEQSVFSSERTSDAQSIYRLKRQVLLCRKAVLPLAAPMGRLADGGVQGVPTKTAPFFRDVADHVMRTSDQIDAIDDLLTSALSAHMASVSVQQNEDMRRISAWVAIVAVPTMIAGVYGMNFTYMPELKWKLGYPGVMVVMVVACFVLHRLFKRAGWL